MEHKIPSILEPSLHNLNTKIIIFDRFGYFTLKPFRLSLSNYLHTNSHAGLRLLGPVSAIPEFNPLFEFLCFYVSVFTINTIPSGQNF